MSSRDKHEHAGCWRCFNTASESRVEAEISWAENPTSGVVPGLFLASHSDDGHSRYGGTGRLKSQTGGPRRSVQNMSILNLAEGEMLIGLDGGQRAEASTPQQLGSVNVLGQESIPPVSAPLCRSPHRRRKPSHMINHSWALAHGTHVGNGKSG